MEKLFEIFRNRAREEKTKENLTGEVFLIVGLGNPGREYRDNRHNVGFMAVDQLARSLEIGLGRMQSKALIGTGMVSGKRLVLAKPQTYMNLSGQAVSGLLHFYKVPVKNLLIIHDDIDLPFGWLRIRLGGGSAGQRGVASIIQQLGTPEFTRIRIGIGRPPGQKAAADYVLQNFKEDEQEILGVVLDTTGNAIRTFVLDGLNKAMNLYNGDQQKGSAL
jgi:PTH1 family peptidyl-tRNA hydrolase